MATEQQRLKKRLQTVFNAYIRKRDSGKPCISCLQHKEEMDAGHFFPVKGYEGLRYDEDNVHGECARCNRFDDSHLIFYAENLKVRIGLRKFKGLKERAAEYKANGKKWSVPELKELIKKYNGKSR